MIRILTLGGLSAVHPERELTGAILQPRRLALLAVLARSGERGVSRDRLLALFWPDEDEERARRALTQAVYALRRDLGAEGAIIGTQELRLDPALITSDIGEFSQLLRSGRHAEAVALYTGPFLQGFHLVGAGEFERWADEERASISHQFARTIERLATAAERSGHIADAVPHWRALATLDPLNANIAVRYMRALVATGDRAGALMHARVYEALMAQELELPPDRAVVELAASLRAAPASPAIPTPTPTPTPPAAEFSPAEPTQTPVIAAPISAAPFVATRVHPPTRRVTAAIALTVMLTIAVGLAFTLRNRASATDIARLRAVDTRRLTHEETLELDPAISPDGRMVAYAAGSEGDMRLYVRQLGGDGAPVIISANVPGDHRRPRWSPDGTRILFQAARGIWMIPALGGSAVLVVEPPRDTLLRATYPAWSPDGRSLAWTTKTEIFSRAIDGGVPRHIATIPTPHSLAWSPDGRFLALASENEAFVYGAAGLLGFTGSNIGNIGPGAIYIVSMATGSTGSTGDTVRVTAPNYLSTSPEWLGDSRRLVFVSNRDGARDLYALALDERGRAAGAPVRLTTGLDAHTVSISADGHTLAFTTFRQSANLWSIPIPRGEPQSVRTAVQLTRGQQQIEAMDVSPDGAWIAYDSDLAGHQDLFRVRTQGGEPERILSSPTDDFHPFWSPDGRTIVFYRIRDGVRRGAVVAATGGVPRFIGAPGGTLEEHSPVWSPDGHHLMFQRYGPKYPDLYEVGQLSDSTWSAPVRLTELGGTGPAFSPDGKEFVYLSKPGEISLLARGSAERTRRIVVSADRADGLTAQQIRWARGQRALYVRARDVRGNVALYEVSLDGGAWRLLVRFDDARHPTVRHEFATDGERFFFTLPERVADIWTARLELR